MTNTRAKVGGEVGMNGEFYKGGQFLPSTMLPKGTQQKQRKGTGKQEIANYVWEVPTKDTHRSLFRLIAGIVAGWKVFNKELEVTASDKTLAYFKMTRETAEMMVKAWNEGARWWDRETGEIV